MKNIIMIIVGGLVFTAMSCKKDNDVMSEELKKENILKARPLDKKDIIILNKILQKNMDSLLPKNVIAREYSSLSGYTYFTSTGDNFASFSVGAYGVEITRSWYDLPSITINPAVQAEYPAYWGYTSLLKLDASNNVLSSQQNKIVNSTDSRPFTSVSISGSEKVWLLFWPKVSGTYMYWY